MYVKKDGKWIRVDDSGKEIGLPKGVTRKSDVDWAPWTGAGGGGLLGYFLTKSMVGDDDKEQSTFKKLLPWLAAAGGALGGYALLNKKAAVANNTEVPEDKNGMPIVDTDGWRHRVGTAFGIGAGASGARAIANFRYNRAMGAQRLIDGINAVNAEEAAKVIEDNARTTARQAMKTHSGLAGDPHAEQRAIDEARINRDAAIAEHRRAAKAYRTARGDAAAARAAAGSGLDAARARAAVDPTYVGTPENPGILMRRSVGAYPDPNNWVSRVKHFFSKNAPERLRWLNWKGQAAGAGVDLAAAGLGHWWGAAHNRAANEAIEDLKTQLKAENLQKEGK